jgi:putative inorganic carbon (hco3(-)) transporter
MKVPDINSIKKIVLVNFGGIGDEILFTPVIRELKKYFPHAEMSLVLEDRSMAVASLIEGIDHFIPLKVQGVGRKELALSLWKTLKSKGYQVVVCSGSSPFIPLMLWATGIPIRIGFKTGFSSNFFLSEEAPLHRQAYAGAMYFSLATACLSYFLGKTDPLPTAVIPTLRIPTTEEQHWAASLMPSGEAKKILIHPGVSQISIDKNILKGWSPKNWSLLIQRLCQHHQVFLVGGPDDRATVEKIFDALPYQQPNFFNLFGETRRLNQLTALIHRCDVLVSVDSSPLHLAVGLQKPVVVMFGPTDEKKLVPAPSPKFISVKLDGVPCRPCLWDVRQTSCDTPMCLDVGVDAMVEAVERVL